MILSTSTDFAELIKAQLGDTLPTVGEELTALVGSLDPEGIHVAAVVHEVNGTVHSLWLVKLIGTVRPRWVWLKTSRAAFAARTDTQAAIAGVALA